MGVAARFSGPGQAYEGLARRRSNGEPQWTGEVAFVEKHLYDPLRWQRPRRIFVNSMSDLFHEKLVIDDIAAVFAVMALARRHTFQVLTKRAQGMLETVASDEFREIVAAHITEYAFELTDPHNRRTDDLRATAPDVTGDNWPLSNVWLGVSVENQAAADERIPFLLNTPAAVRFLSCEPLLGPVRLRDTWTNQSCGTLDPIDWVIAGGESGPHARPMHPDWPRWLRDQCQAAGVPFFFKQWGEWVAEDQSPQDAVMPAESRAFYGDAGPSLFRIGKKAAGRELDDRKWDEYPQQLLEASV